MKVLSFWTLIPFTVRIALVAALVAALGTGFLMYRRSLINQGKAEGRESVLQDLEERYGEEWQIELASIEEERESLETEKLSVENEKEEVARLRRQTAAELSAGIRRLHEEVIRHGQDVIAVPAGDLPGRIRTVLAGLRATDRDRSEGGFAPAAGAANDAIGSGTP